MYDFTKLQAIICVYADSFDASVASEKVVINNNVYAVSSAESLAVVTKDADNKKIIIGVTNDNEYACLLRYFMYKEVD